MDLEEQKQKMRGKVPIYATDSPIPCPLCGRRLLAPPLGERHIGAAIRCPDCAADYSAELVVPELRATDPYIFLTLRNKN